MPSTRREERERERVRRAAMAARTRRQSALDVALAEIGAAFDEAAIVNDFKIRVERLIRLGPHHPAVQARFGARAVLLSGRSLDATVIIVEHWWRDERKAFQIASALGRGSRYSVEVLRDLRLILRLMRFKRMAAEFFAALHDEPIAAAAE